MYVCVYIYIYYIYIYNFFLGESEFSAQSQVSHFFSFCSPFRTLHCPHYFGK